MRQAIFIDKDGTLITDVPYNADPEKIRLEHAAGAALKRLHDAGYYLILVTNQAGIAHGKFPEGMLCGVFKRINQLLLEEGQVEIDRFYYCPHHPEAKLKKYRKPCDCRKPLPGMLQQAALENNIDLANSWMIGDILDDVEAGNRAGCHTILIDNGNETKWEPGAYRNPTLVANGLLTAAEMILHD